MDTDRPGTKGKPAGGKRTFSSATRNAASNKVDHSKRTKAYTPKKAATLVVHGAALDRRPAADSKRPQTQREKTHSVEEKRAKNEEELEMEDFLVHRGPKDFFQDVYTQKLVPGRCPVFRDGWVLCECLATEHALVTNCGSCGKIVCTLEIQKNALPDRLRFIDLYGPKGGLSSLPMDSAARILLENAADSAVFCPFCGQRIVAMLANGESNALDLDENGDPIWDTISASEGTLNAGEDAKDNNDMSNGNGQSRSGPRKKNKPQKVVLLSTSSGVNKLFPRRDLNGRPAPLIPRTGPLFAEKRAPDILDKFNMQQEEEKKAANPTIESGSKSDTRDVKGKSVENAHENTNPDAEEDLKRLPDRSNISDPALRAAMEQRDRLLLYQDTGAQRTRVRDLASDFDYRSDSQNQWLTKEQRDKASSLQTKLEQDSSESRSRKPIQITLDLTSNTMTTERPPSPGSIARINKEKL